MGTLASSKSHDNQPFGNSAVHPIQKHVQIREDFRSRCGITTMEPICKKWSMKQKMPNKMFTAIDGGRSWILKCVGIHAFAFTAAFVPGLTEHRCKISFYTQCQVRTLRGGGNAFFDLIKQSITTETNSHSEPVADAQFGSPHLRKDIVERDKV